MARKIRPRRFLGFIVIGWGLVTVGQGLVKTWKAMLALRCILGILEAGYFSSCVYLVSTWYIRSSCFSQPPTAHGWIDSLVGEVAKRNAVFYLSATFLSGFGGILAYGVSSIPLQQVFLTALKLQFGESSLTSV